MADKPISGLPAAEQITAPDLFVLEQAGTAKKLTGQILLNWLTAAADGHGGISGIAKVSTSGLADTYRITLADTTYYDFVVTNGRGISSIKKTSTSGLVDTYTITYNDGTSGTFTVTNGAKGEKGDNAYIWIKYASQEPTEDSHSFGDAPDAWMGVYFGGLNTAPTDWKQYAWYKIRGDKGDTGEPATLISSSVTYQVGDSGSIIPSGVWSESVAVVPQGKYLWTRVVHQFNTGSATTAYSVSRMGLDGLGSVVSVANVSPDANGNVPLTADDVKALPIAGGSMTGGINMNGQTLNGLNPPTEDSGAVSKGYLTELLNVQNLFSVGVEASVKSYPTKPGIYCTAGVEIFANLTEAHGLYGTLVIFKGTYSMHIYIDNDGKMFWGRTYEDFGEPKTWYTALPSSGGTMTGTLTLNGVVLTEGKDFGTALPSNPVDGQFFVLIKE